MEQEINGFAHMKDSLQEACEEDSWLQKLSFYLEHQLIDISIEALSVLSYLLGGDEVQGKFVGALVEKNIDLTVVAALNRFDERLERDRFGVSCALEIVESIANVSFLKRRLFDAVKKWLIERVQLDLADAQSNKCAATDLLALFCQSADCELEREEFDLLFKLIFSADASTQKDEDDESFCNGLTDALCASLLNSPKNLEYFVSEPFLLSSCIQQMRTGKRSSKENALKIIDYALNGGNSSTLERLALNFVAQNGPKTLFPLLMKSKICSELESLCISVAYSLICNLNSSEAAEARQRVISKFAENDFEKKNKLIDSLQADNKEEDSFFIKEALLKVLEEQ